MAPGAESGGSWLEGLVLRDGAGCFYEVPRVVIERYQVTEERAKELATPPAAQVMPCWAVQGGVYADGAAGAERCPDAT